MPPYLQAEQTKRLLSAEDLEAYIAARMERGEHGGL
jgi:hypothetical protein